MSTLARDEQAIVWPLRGYWAARRVVIVTLSERCLVRTVVGRVAGVAVTGAFAVIDGWHLPMEDILRAERATVAQRDEYEATIRAANREARRRAYEQISPGDG